VRVSSVASGGHAKRIGA